MFLTLLLCGLVAGCSSGQATQGKASRPVADEERRLVLSSTRVDLTAAAIRSPRSVRLALRTPEGRRLALVRDRQERIGEAGIVWQGRVQGDSLSSATIVENRGALAGTIFTSGATYRVRGAPDGVYLDRIDQRGFLPDAEPSPRSGLRNNSADPSADTCTTDSGADIDVMVVYTDDARAAAGGTAQMEAEVYLAVALTNESYINSNITQRLRLVHVAEVNYAESGNTQTDRDRLKNPSDGFLDNVHPLRNTFAADSVMLIAQTYNNACGQSYIMDPVGNAFEDSAFGVVSRSCSAANLSFPHELGHQMSARHDWAADPTNNSPFAFNHGYARPSPSNSSVAPWRTVMAYPCSSVNCTRLTNWSNPNVLRGGDAMGVATGSQRADNAQTLNLTATTVANFRCSSAGRTDVWMKDTWNDTGAEPDVLAAGEVAYAATDMWVNPVQDPLLIHQHQHENPVLGQTNWVYVKLHNGGGGQTGNLIVYYGDASTGLVWPGSFTQIASTPVTIAAHSAQIVEVPWSNLPAAGHYCLIARWVSATDPMNSEGSDVNANTIANNNIIWRNVNIIDLGHDATQNFSVRVRNPDRRRPTLTSLRFELPRNANGLSLARFGEVSFELDPRLLRQVGYRIRMEGMTGRGQGVLMLNRGIESAWLRGIMLPPGAEGVIRIRVRRLASATRGDVLRLNVQQWREGAPTIRAYGAGRLVGGVVYDIRTGPSTAYFAPRAR
jgi:hypothetical protein